MVVELAHKEGCLFEARCSKESFVIDAHNISPLEYFVGGMLSCCGTDMLQQSRKQGLPAQNLTVRAEVIRSSRPPNHFDAVHLIFEFDSEAEDITARRWVLASLEAYSSTINTVRFCARIYYTIRHNGELVADMDGIISGKDDREYDFSQIKNDVTFCELG